MFKAPDSNDWIISDHESTRLIQKIQKTGKLIKEFDIEVNRGLLTGRNAAFIIDENKKNELILLDPKNQEIIKPILRGRDLKKYSYEFAKFWAICTFPCLKINIDQYPTIKSYFLNFGKERLEQSGTKVSRKKTNNKWLETQDSVSYWKDFEEPKIIWGEISDKPKFAYDDSNYMVRQLHF
jgi:hypothetical protein